MRGLARATPPISGFITSEMIKSGRCSMSASRAFSPGTGYADGVFENNTSPDEFYGARIFWDGRGSWTVQMRDGWQYTIQGCSANVPIGADLQNGEQRHEILSGTCARDWKCEGENDRAAQKKIREDLSAMSLHPNLATPQPSSTSPGDCGVYRYCRDGQLAHHAVSGL